MVHTTLLMLLALTVQDAEVRSTRTMTRARNHYENGDCERNGTCSLKRVSFLKEDYEVTLTNGAKHYGVRFVAEYETDSLETLEDYVFVQFIRGCVFVSRPTPDGTVAEFSSVYGSGGPVFYFPHWRVDTYDDDPAYGSYKKYGRHAYTRWSAGTEPLNTEKARFYFSKKPENPILFIKDHPSTGFAFERGAQNVSMQFRTCMYRSRDVPDSVDPDDEFLAEPLICYGWENYFVYDHAAGRFDWPRRSQDVCPAQPSEK